MAVPKCHNYAALKNNAVRTQLYDRLPSTYSPRYRGPVHEKATAFRFRRFGFVHFWMPDTTCKSRSCASALQDLYTSLTTGANIPASVTEIQNALNQVSQQRVFYGNNLNQISLSESFLNQDKLNLSKQENTLVGADLATAATNFAQAQVANQATLNATARVLGLPTLLDFLK
jgi:flagellin-like hook-associated protein FlgL